MTHHPAADRAPDSPELAQHAAGAIARHSRRGWRIDRPNPRVEIDGSSALMMALDRLENRPEPWSYSDGSELLP